MITGEKIISVDIYILTEKTWKRTSEAIPAGEKAHSFSQTVSNLFHFIILSLPMWFYIWLSKNFSKPTSKNGERKIYAVPGT